MHPEAPRSAVGSSALFRRKRRSKALDVVSAAIPGGVAAGNKSIKSMINRTRIGDIVEFSGNLIRVDAKDGWHWLSSLSRTDKGGHSCELIWVEKFEIQKF